MKKDLILNNMQEIYTDKEVRDKLISGINKLSEAVGKTMGPKGATVIIPDKDTYGKYKVTKDGVSVAREVKLSDPIENIGAELIKQAAEKTVFEAGDGTTTATILASAFVNNLKDFESNEINKAFDEIIPKVLEQLKLNSRELKRKDIKHVASISANNDIQIGDLIQQAYNHSNIVKIEEGDHTEDVLELIEGMSLPVSYFSKHFINNERKGTCEFNEPNMLLLDGKLEKLENFRAAIEKAAEPGQSLLIITEHVHEQALRKLESLVLSGNLNLCIIKTPGVGKHRRDLLRDLSDFTGATVITDFNKTYNDKILGQLKSCAITKNNSILVKHPDIEIEEFIDVLKELSASKDLESYDKELVLQRIEHLTGKVSIIKVGGKTPNEIKERFDRYDDAVKAVACALEEGIVEGGGYALIKSTLNLEIPENNLIYSEILKSLQKPYCTIFKERKIIYSDNSEVYNFDMNIDMFDQNIIDPLKVTRCALENAASVAKVILSTKAVVLNESEWKHL